MTATKISYALHAKPSSSDTSTAIPKWSCTLARRNATSITYPSTESQTVSLTSPSFDPSSTTVKDIILNSSTATSDLLASLLPGGEAEDDDSTAQKPIYQKVAPSSQIQSGILAVVQADVNDTAEHIRDASVIGFVQVTEVDERRRKLKILPPIGLQVPRRAMIWGAWPSDLGELVR